MVNQFPHATDIFVNVDQVLAFWPDGEEDEYTAIAMSNGSKIIVFDTMHEVAAAFYE